MYTYYKKIEKDEHMLYASEIAEAYGILTVNNKCATRLVSNLLDDYIKKNNLKSEQLYYITTRGFIVKVYPRDLYREVMYKFADALFEKYGSSLSEYEKLQYKINDTNFTFKIRR